MVSCVLVTADFFSEYWSLSFSLSKIPLFGIFLLISYHKQLYFILFFPIFLLCYNKLNVTYRQVCDNILVEMANKSDIYKRTLIRDNLYIGIHVQLQQLQVHKKLWHGCIIVCFEVHVKSFLTSTSELFHICYWHRYPGDDFGLVFLYKKYEK